jgi:LemA protein
MSRGLVIALVVIAVLVVGIGAWAVSVNNQLVVLDQGVAEKWSQVQNVYQRRADLIPNLVETVKGFAAQERTVLEEVTRARASASSIQLTPEALNDPKALERFQAVQSQLEGTENRIAVERRRFNESVREYNTRLRLFPGSLVASFSGYQPKAFFEAAPGAETVPKVKF